MKISKELSEARNLCQFGADSMATIQKYGDTGKTNFKELEKLFNDIKGKIDKHLVED